MNTTVHSDKSLLSNNINYFVPISKVDPVKQMIYGYASIAGNLDLQGERVSLEALKNALPGYMEWGAIREQHDPHKAVGTTKEAHVDEKGMWIGAKIVEPMTWTKIKEGVLKGFSIGGERVSKVGDTITAMRLDEISVVDKPANPLTKIDVVKAVDPSYKPTHQVEEIEALTDFTKWNASKAEELTIEESSFLTKLLQKVSKTFSSPMPRTGDNQPRPETGFSSTGRFDESQANQTPAPAAWNKPENNGGLTTITYDGGVPNYGDTEDSIACPYCGVHIGVNDAECAGCGEDLQKSIENPLNKSEKFSRLNTNDIQDAHNQGMPWHVVAHATVSSRRPGRQEHVASFENEQDAARDAERRNQVLGDSDLHLHHHTKEIFPDETVDFGREKSLADESFSLLKASKDSLQRMNPPAYPDGFSKPASLPEDFPHSNHFLPEYDDNTDHMVVPVDQDTGADDYLGGWEEIDEPFPGGALRRRKKPNVPTTREVMDDEKDMVYDYGATDDQDADYWNMNWTHPRNGSSPRPIAPLSEREGINPIENHIARGSMEKRSKIKNNGECYFCGEEKPDLKADVMTTGASLASPGFYCQNCLGHQRNLEHNLKYGIYSDRPGAKEHLEELENGRRALRINNKSIMSSMEKNIAYEDDKVVYSTPVLDRRALYLVSKSHHAGRDYHIIQHNDSSNHVYDDFVGSHADKRPAEATAKELNRLAIAKAKETGDVHVAEGYKVHHTSRLLPRRTHSKSIEDSMRRD